MSIADALSSTTLRWRAVRGARPGYDLVAGSDDMATARHGEVEIDDHLYRVEVIKNGFTLVDVATGARVASVRPMAHGPVAINVHGGRYRLSRKGVLPFAQEVTRDVAGPQILQLLHVGPVVRVRAGRDVEDAPPAERALLVVLTGMLMLDLLAPSTPVAA